MAHQSHDRECIALQQLEAALQAWFDQESYFVVITLAGAAEEILGKALKHAGVSNALESLEASFLAMLTHVSDEQADRKWARERANAARNQAKHFDLGQSPTIHIDAREEARDMLNRAVDNYWRLKQHLTPNMLRFQQEQHAA